MPAWVGGARALGMKWVSYFPGNFARGLPDSTGIIILNDPDLGLPCCIMEGMYVTFLRTAACAAVAAKYLAPRPPKTLGLIGCGGLGLWSLRMMTATFPSIEQVFVSSRTRRSREEFCAKMSQDGKWTIMPVDDPLDAVRNMDIVVTSIPPGDVKPVTGEALTPGRLLIPLDLVNSWQDNVLPVGDRVAADNPGAFFGSSPSQASDGVSRRSSRRSVSRISSLENRRALLRRSEASSRCAASPARTLWSAGKSTAAPKQPTSGLNSICWDKLSQREVGTCAAT